LLILPSRFVISWNSSTPQGHPVPRNRLLLILVGFIAEVTAEGWYPLGKVEIKE
jgi:hypothetical protein